MKTALLSFICIVFFCSHLDAQKNYRKPMKSMEFGWFSGISNYTGDLRQLRFEASSSEFATGVFFRNNFSNNVSYKTHLYYGKLRGDDSVYAPTDISLRNLSFETVLIEWAHIMEFSFMDFGTRKERIAAHYVFLGVSGFYFNPKAFYVDRWVELQPLGTEGQRLPGGTGPYSRFQVAIPFGLGFNIRVGDYRDVVIGFEVGFHKTFTDYIDDIAGVYPEWDDFNKMPQMTKDLSYRSTELPGFSIDDYPSGERRGDNNKYDTFFFGGICVSKYFKRYVPDRNYRKYKTKNSIL